MRPMERRPGCKRKFQPDRPIRDSSLYGIKRISVRGIDNRQRVDGHRSRLHGLQMNPMDLESL